MQLNNVKVFEGLRWQSVNTSFSIRKNVLTNRMLTGVNKTPTPLTLRRITDFSPTLLRRLSDCEDFCTFADDKIRSFFPHVRRACARHYSFNHFSFTTMALIHSILGKMNGKLGNVVLASTGGSVVAREYNPNVSNPNTEKQVDQRAKLKLMSQLAAALSPIIVIPKEGLKSSRNLFIKKNIDKASAESGVAQVTYENLQITAGNAGLPAIYVRRSQQSGVTVELSERAGGNIARVVYALYAKTSESTLQYVQSVVSETAGTEGKFPASMLYTAGDIVVFAYGMIDKNANATAKYSDYNVQSGLDIAKLTMTRSINANDYGFTLTRGVTLFSNESESIVVPEGSARVFVTAQGPGTVEGAGVFEIGSQVTVRATPDDGKFFVGWYVNGSNTNLSELEEFTFELTQQTDLVARFSDTEDDGLYRVTVQSNNEALGTVQPAGLNTVEQGDPITLEATPIGSNTFSGWYLNSVSGDPLSTESNYTYTPQANCTIIGRFAAGFDEG